jgi:hypothetical protein
MLYTLAVSNYRSLCQFIAAAKSTQILVVSHAARLIAALWSGTITAISQSSKRQQQDLLDQCIHRNDGGDREGAHVRRCALKLP